MSKKLNASHGIVCRKPGEKFGCFAWPTVARMDDGTLAVVCSGLRSQHICPWGKTVFSVSRDDGASWSEPRVIQDSMIDDRDAGIVNLGGGKLLVSWFRSDTRQYTLPFHKWMPPEWVQEWTDADAFADWTDATVESLLGSWVMLSDDAGATWGEPIRVPVSAPHGPVRLANGELLYLGKDFRQPESKRTGDIQAARSSDGGRTWETLGSVPIYPNTVGDNYHEPHVVELPSGKLIGAIRMENGGGVDLARDAGIPNFSLMQTESDDGGRTWTPARPLGFHGSPPHLIRHSSGVLVLTYGYRQSPLGERVAFSRDDGATWDHDWILRDDAPGDVGYPATVELADGSLFSVYYQQAAPDEKCSILCSRWQLNNQA
jgi:sialidase-1